MLPKAKKFEFKNLLIIIFMIYTILPLTSIPLEGNIPSNLVYNPFTSSIPGDEPSSYTTSNNVTYKIEVIYSIWTVNTQNPVRIFIPRIQNHAYPDFPGVAPIQKSVLLSNTSNFEDFASSVYIYDEGDDYGNQFDSYELTLKPTSPNFNYQADYNVSLFQTEWNTSSTQTFDDYAPYTSEEWYLNLTGAEDKFDVDNPDLITLSNSLSTEKESIMDIASAIHTWVDENIEYEIQENDNGAIATYSSGLGDCSDYSSLMITLLRIQGIPARRILGVTFMQPGTTYGFYKTEAGDSVTYVSNNTEDTMPLHAWIEYYVPDIGFVVSDPTWNLFNQIDYIHLTTSVGANFGGGLEMEVINGISEIPAYPMVIGSANTFNNLRWSYTIKITVLEANLSLLAAMEFQVEMGLIIGVVITILSVSIVIWALRYKKSNY